MSQPDLLRAVVIDDEQLAREEVCFLLGKLGGVESSARQATASRRCGSSRSRPGPRLLDVQMPGPDRLRGGAPPPPGGRRSAVVFVTAYDRHAIEAFDVNAVDYLLKPVESGRLQTALERVRRRLQTGRAPAQPRAEELDRCCKCSRSGGRTAGSSSP
jgi:DNA-binding LytR/AlgR family response regulator